MVWKRFLKLLNIKIADLDFDRKMLHVKQGKGRKDRYVPLGDLLIKGLKKFIISEKPKTKQMICPACQKGKLKIVCTFSGRAPPEYWIDRIKSQDVKHEKNKR